MKNGRCLRHATTLIEHTFDDTENYFELVRACLNIFPDMERMFKTFIDGKNKKEELIFIVNNKILSLEELWFKIKKNTAMQVKKNQMILLLKKVK